MYCVLDVVVEENTNTKTMCIFLFFFFLLFLSFSLHCKHFVWLHRARATVMYICNLCYVEMLNNNRFIIHTDYTGEYIYNITFIYIYLLRAGTEFIYLCLTLS